MRKSDEQELIRLRSYRQNQDLVIEEQAQKIVRLDLELKRARAELAEAQRGLQRIGEIEQRIEKEKRAFMRHHKKEMEKAVGKVMDANREWKKIFATLQKNGVRFLDTYLKEHPGLSVEEAANIYADREAIGQIIGMVSLEMFKRRKEKKEAMKPSEVL